MQRFLIMWAIALAAMQTGCGVRARETAPVESFRFLTYNICKEADSWHLTIDTIRELKADIVALQETTPDWEAQLRKDLAADYPHMEFRDSVSKRNGGLGFFSKRPMKEVAYVPSDGRWFDGWIMRFETPAGDVQVLNVHLRPPVTEDGKPTLSSLLGTGGVRRHEIEHFHRKVDAALPLIVAGDFNDDDASASVAFLRGHRLTDALSEFDPWTETWRWSSLPLIQRRLDHVMYGSPLHCYEARVIKEGGSDHWPVLAVFGTMPGPP